MVSVFISYSTKDSKFVNKLVRDLERMGLEIWLDKWEIRVGDDIFDKIQSGVRNSDFGILVLSRNAMSSGWVDKEWKMVYWNEIESGRVRLLPILIEDCKIPEFLKFKKYADFRKKYDEALKELLRVFRPIESSSRKKADKEIPTTGISSFQSFQEVYDYAYSPDGMDLSREDAKKFVLEWFDRDR